MEVGCGPGIVVSDLKRRGINIRGVELGAATVLAGLESDVKTQTDIFDLGERDKADIRAVLMLDVLEHIEDRKRFLKRVCDELPNCRLLLLTVPARMEIWSDYDKHWGHHLRYDRSILESELKGSGFTPQKSSYFFQWVYLVSLLMSLAGLAKSNSFEPILPGSLKALLHKTLGFITRTESRVVPGFVVGSSIICIASREDSLAHAEINNAL